jgi:hypothetical protein
MLLQGIPYVIIEGLSFHKLIVLFKLVLLITKR